MTTMTFYICRECSVVVGTVLRKKALIIRKGDPRFPEKGNSWEHFLDCPVCKKPTLFDEHEMVCDGR